MITCIKRSPLIGITATTQNDKMTKRKKDMFNLVSQPNCPHPLIAVGSSTIRRAENQQTEPDIRLVDMLNLNIKMIYLYFCLFKLPEFICTNSSPSIDSQGNLYKQQSSKTRVEED